MVNIFVKRFTFCARNLPEGDMMYYFKPQFKAPEAYKGDIGIPKYLFDLSENTPEEFIKILNESYTRILQSITFDQTDKKPQPKKEKESLYFLEYRKIQKM